MSFHAIEGPNAGRAAQGAEKWSTSPRAECYSNIPLLRFLVSILPPAISQIPSLLPLEPLSPLYPALPNPSVLVPGAHKTTLRPSPLPLQAAIHPTYPLTVRPGPNLTFLIDRSQPQRCAQACTQSRCRHAQITACKTTSR